uniref:SNRNP25 ubiquitin-like domain-containing protein n=1 Tax=Vombatus ursinus TaxID=29139 RepID=A0A4X2L5A5_VOMUR
MIVQDPLLCDLPFQVTLEEINSQIALEYGQAMIVRVCKVDGEVMPVVVVQNATTLDLKKAIQRYVQLKQEREGGIQGISCKSKTKKKPPNTQKKISQQRFLVVKNQKQKGCPLIGKWLTNYGI